MITNKQHYFIILMLLTNYNDIPLSSIFLITQVSDCFHMIHFIFPLLNLVFHNAHTPILRRFSYICHWIVFYEYLNEQNSWNEKLFNLNTFGFGAARKDFI